MRYRFAVDPRLTGPELRVQHVAIGAAVNSGRALAGVVEQGFLFHERHAFAFVFSFHRYQLCMHRDNLSILQRAGGHGARTRTFSETRRTQSQIIAIDQFVLTDEDRLAVLQLMLRDTPGLEERSVRASEILKSGFFPNRFDHGVSAADTFVVVQHDVAGGMATDRRLAQFQVHVTDRLAPEFDYEFAHGLVIFRSWRFYV